MARFALIFLTMVSLAAKLGHKGNTKDLRRTLEECTETNSSSSDKDKKLIVQCMMYSAGLGDDNTTTVVCPEEYTQTDCRLVQVSDFQEL